MPTGFPPFPESTASHLHCVTPQKYSSKFLITFNLFQNLWSRALLLSSICFLEILFMLETVLLFAKPVSLLSVVPMNRIHSSWLRGYFLKFCH